MNNIVTNICYIYYTLFIHLLMIMIKYCLHTWNSNYQHEHWLLIFLASWGARPSLTLLPQADPISLRSQAKPRSHVGHNNILFIDGHVYWDSNCWLPFIFCWPRKKTSIFCFHLHQTNGSLLFPFYICNKHTEVAVFCSSHFPYKYINICKEKWHHIYNNPLSIRQLLIVQMKVCRLSVCWQRIKPKLSVCKWTEQIKQACPSMNIPKQSTRNDEAIKQWSNGMKH